MFIYLNGRRVWTELSAADSGGNDGSDGAKAAFERLLERNNNDAARVAEKLFDENYQYRKEIRQLEQQVPPAGAVVLSADDAGTWQAYQALGKPSEVKQALEERTKLQGDLVTRDRELLLRSVADTAGYKPGVLASLDRLAKAEGKVLDYVVKDVQTADGKTVKMSYVKEGDKELTLPDYVATNWTDYAPALVVQPLEVAQTNGTRFVTQHAGNGSASKTDPVAEFMKRQETSRAAVKNPLLKE